MKEVTWSSVKSERLKKTRGVSFEELMQAKFLGARRHPTQPHQRIMLVEHQGYVWVVPFVENEHQRFLKTLYPSRKYTKLYRKGGLS